MPLQLHIPREPRNTRLVRQAAILGFGVFLLVVTYLALTPGPSAPPRILGIDKVEHFAAFAVLAILARAAWPSIRAWGIGVSLLVYGVLIETIQASPILMRTASAGDVIADLAGILGGLLVVSLWQKFASRYETAPR
jgi:VanZ family protein